ncbi:dTDP-4-dehydrorhamnose 3,5-epimerase [Candidatus Latescibacterota bacterium]
MKLTPTAIPDVLIIKMDVIEDERGFFTELYQVHKFAEAGINHAFVQDNRAGSRQGVLRGMHYQIRQTQGKLVQAIVGTVYDVVIDLRHRSPTFGKWVGNYLSDKEKIQLWIPPGFAHGYYVMSEWAEIFYKATDFYAPQWERTLLWNDPDIGIEWPLIDGHQPIVSLKDAQGKRLADAELFDSSNNIRSPFRSP